MKHEQSPAPRLILGLLLAVVVAACSSQGRIEGPVLTSAKPPFFGGSGIDGLVSGTVVFDADSGCLFLENGDNRDAVVWPAGASWRDDPPALALRGQVIEPGTVVSGGGGYVDRDWIAAEAGAAVADAAADCAGEDGDIAFFNVGSNVEVVAE